MKDFNMLFSFNGKIRVNAPNDARAFDKAEEFLKEYALMLEKAMRTGITIDIYDVFTDDEL